MARSLFAPRSLVPLLSLLAAFPAPRDAAAQVEPGPPAASQPAPPEAVTNPFGRKYPPRVYQTVRLQAPPPSIDGRLDDAAWQEGAWAGGYKQQVPVEGAPPSAETELKILYDDKHLYFAIRAFDDPAKVADILGPMPNEEEFFGKVKSMRPPKDVEPHMAYLYERPLLTREQEAHTFRKMNYLRFKADRTRAAIDPETATAAELDRIDDLVSEAGGVKNEIVQSNLRLVVSISKRHNNRQTDFFETVSDGWGITGDYHEYAFGSKFD